MPHTRFTTDEIVDRGEEIYEQRLRPLVESGNKGKYLVVDIETGDYAIGEEYGPLLDQLHARHRDAALYVKRIGYDAAVTIGWFPPPNNR